jgi:hypothetical protein
VTNKIDIICLNFRFYLLILKKKIEDFLHHDYVRMVYIKKSSKIRLKFSGKLRRKISKKGVFHLKLSEGYQSGINKLSEGYQSGIKRLSKSCKLGMKICLKFKTRVRH